MKKNLFTLLLLQSLGLGTLINAQDTLEFTDLYGDYLGQTPPGDTPVVFARGIISTDDQEHGIPAFSPDGNEVFWQVNQRSGSGWLVSGMTMQRVRERWTAPTITPCLGPIFSTDGKRLYFQLDGKDKDLYFMEKHGNSWSEPKRLGLVARFPDVQFAYMPSATRNGTLYFLGYAAGLRNNFGIYRSECFNREYAKPELLPPGINLPGYINWTPFIAPDESYLIFSSTRETSSTYDMDLYICFRQSDGNWTKPVSLGEAINTHRQERYPTVSPDGKYLFFTRDNPPHDEDIFWVRAKVINDLKRTYEMKKG